MRKTSGWILIALIVTAGAGTIALADAAPGRVVDRLQAAYRAGSTDDMLALYSADATFEDINQRHKFSGRAQLEGLLAQIVGMHLSMDLVETRRVVDGNTVVVEYAYRGQLNGAALGAAVGKEGCPDLRYSLPTTSWYQIEDGRITHQKDFIDWATLVELRQQMLAAGSDATRAGGDTGSD